MAVQKVEAAASFARSAARSSMWALLICNQMACAHAGYGGRAFDEVPLGVPVERFLRTVWSDFESLERAEESGRLWIEVDEGGMPTVKVPASELDFGVEFAGSQPTVLSISLWDGRIRSAGFSYHLADVDQVMAVAEGIHDYLELETGHGPSQIAPFAFVWPDGDRIHIVGIELERKVVAWGIASVKLMAEANEGESE